MNEDECQFEIPGRDLIYIVLWEYTNPHIIGLDETKLMSSV